jgi:ABC-type lipoprotein release transport system permease subunit
MLLLLAWKNIWRNKKRSGIIIAAIIFGLWGGLFSGAVMMGMIESMVETSISRNLSHIQLHQPDYQKDHDVRHIIPNGPDVVDTIARQPGVRAVSGRILVQGMAASASSSYAMRLIGIDTAASRQVTDIHTHIREGTFLQSKRRNPIVIGAKLAERLNLRLKSKIILSFQDLDGNIAYMACRVVGIFKTSSTQFDETNGYVRQTDLYRILETEPIIHEIALLAADIAAIDPLQQKLATLYPQLEVETWKQLAPELAYLSESSAIYTYIFVAIILFALLFGITNTMLMSVVDRIREFGVLIAIGMKKSRVFAMIVLETVMLSLTGGAGGIAVGVMTIAYYGNSGIDLSAISASLESFGASTMLYPFLPLVMYVVLTIMIVIAANIAALLPAWKAINLVPSEAIRTY